MESEAIRSLSRNSGCWGKRRTSNHFFRIECLTWGHACTGPRKATFGFRTGERETDGWQRRWGGRCHGGRKQGDLQFPALEESLKSTTRLGDCDHWNCGKDQNFPTITFGTWSNISSIINELPIMAGLHHSDHFLLSGGPEQYLALLEGADYSTLLSFH